MTSVARRGPAGGPPAGWLAYWLLPRADRRAVRLIETSCRALGNPRLDGIALARLRRAARRERLLGPIARRGATTPCAADRLARLCSTLRHPSRTGACRGSRAAAPATPVRTRPRTS